MTWDRLLILTPGTTWASRPILTPGMTWDRLLILTPGTT
jgi:hypothetical protein